MILYYLDYLEPIALHKSSFDDSSFCQYIMMMVVNRFVIVVELFLKSVCLPQCLIWMLLVGKISEKTNPVHFIGKNKVYYDGDLLVRFMYPTSFFTSKINVFARNKEIPQTSSPLLDISIEVKIAKTFCL